MNEYLEERAYVCSRCNETFETLNALVKHEAICLEDFIKNNPLYRSSLFKLLFENHSDEASKFLERWLKGDTQLRDELTAHTALHYGETWVNVLNDAEDFRTQMTETIISNYAEELGTSLNDQLAEDADSNIVERLLADANILMQELTLHLATNCPDLWENALHALPNFRERMIDALVTNFSAELTELLKDKYENETKDLENNG